MLAPASAPPRHWAANLPQPQPLWGGEGGGELYPNSTGQGLSPSNLHFLFPSQPALVKLVGRSS